MLTPIDHVRRVSHAAFTQRYRLELMLEVAESGDGIVSLTELATALGVTPSKIQASFESLVVTGLLTELPDVDSRRKYFFRNASAAWAWARELAGIPGDCSDWRTATARNVDLQHRDYLVELARNPAARSPMARPR